MRERVRGVVTRWPRAIIALALLITAGFSALMADMTVVDAGGVENETTEITAEIEEQFDDQQSVVQILVTSDSDVRSVEALEASTSIREAIEEDSAAADTLAETEGYEPVVGFLDGVEFSTEAIAADPSSLSESDVVDFYEDAQDQLPQEAGELVESLLGNGEPPTSGLMVVFQDTTGLDDDQIIAQQREIIERIESVDVPSSIEVEAFSFELMLGDQEVGAEVGRLFTIALGLILVVLAGIYWIRPQAGQRGRIIRRTLADVLLTLAVIMMAVLWMYGIGVLLGPGYLDVIGPFSPEIDVVPILLVSLGVDFGIHLLARYRDELGVSASPDPAYHRAARTVGVTLAVATGATAIGFLTNITSPVNFMQTLGVLAAAGTVAAFVLSLTFLAASRVLLDRRAERKQRLPASRLSTQGDRLLPRLSAKAGWLPERAPVFTVLVALLLTTAGGYGFTQMDTRYALTDFVPQDAAELVTYEQIEDDFDGGFAEVTEVLLRGDLDSPEAEDALEESLENVMEVDTVEMLQGEPEVQESSGDPDRGLVSLRTNAGLSGALELASDLETAFGPLTDLDVEVQPASIEIAQAETSDDIGETQAQSLAIALGAAMLLLLAYYTALRRRPALGIIAMVPVAMVLAWTFGMMSLTDIPLNPVTATLAALSIGIAVPFAIHITSRFLEERESHDSPMGALRTTLSRTGGALAGTAVTTVLGFGVLMTSTLVPFQQLGYVIVYVIAFSMIASLLVLPSLLALWNRWDQRKDKDREPSRSPS